MVAEPVAQRAVQEVRHRMVGTQPAAALVIDTQLDCIADFERTMCNRAVMDEKVARFPSGVANRKFAAGRGEHDPGVADLATGLAVEWGLIDDDRDLVADGGGLDPCTALKDGEDDALGALGLVAKEFGGADFFAQGEPLGTGRRLARADPTLARLIARSEERRVGKECR